MRDFDTLYQIAANHKGGAQHLEALMPEVRSPQEIAAIGDDRWLAAMTQRIFSAGFVWRVIEAKWPSFETVFHHFDVDRMTRFSDAEMEAAAGNAAIVRNPQKIKTVRQNARFIQEIAQEHGSFSQLVADWPDDDVVGLWHLMKKQGARLGGNTGPYMLRFMGKDTFLLTPDVITALQQDEIVGAKVTSLKAQRAAQDAFLEWRAQSGRPLAHISRILACTVASSPFPDPDNLP